LEYRVKPGDVIIIVPFITQLGLYLSPVGFSSSIVPEKGVCFNKLQQNLLPSTQLAGLIAKNNIFHYVI